MTEQTNYEKAERLIGWVGKPLKKEETPWVAGFAIEKGQISALLAVADELRALREMLAKYPWPIIASDGRVAYINPEIQCPECEAITQDWPRLQHNKGCTFSRTPRVIRPSGPDHHEGQDYY